MPRLSFSQEGKMTEQRKMEIALMIVEDQAVRRGIPGGEQLKREVGQMADRIGLKTEELMAFCESLVPKVYGRMFGYSSVGITANGRR